VVSVAAWFHSLVPAPILSHVATACSAAASADGMQSVQITLNRPESNSVVLDVVVFAGYARFASLDVVQTSVVVSYMSLAGILCPSTGLQLSICSAFSVGSGVVANPTFDTIVSFDVGFGPYQPQDEKSCYEL